LYVYIFFIIYFNNFLNEAKTLTVLKNMYTGSKSILFQIILKEIVKVIHYKSDIVIEDLKNNDVILLVNF